MKDIGSKIKKLREDKGIKPEFFAEAIGMSKSTLERIEKGEKSPTLEEVSIISKELGISEEELIFGEPKIVFENCNQKMFFNRGTIHYQAHEEVKNVYEKLISEQKEEINFLRGLVNNKK